MLQAILQEPKTIVYRDIPLPDPAPGQVLMQVMRIGICGSDIHVLIGINK